MEGFLIFAIYSAWALFSGYKMVNGRYAWLEQPATTNRVCKWLVVLGAGYVIGAFYLIYRVIRIALRVTDGFR